jgi:hypothetical protein
MANRDDANQDIREEIETARLRYWQVAKKYGCADTTFSKKMRTEMTAAEKDEIRKVIAQLIKERDQN